MVARPAAERWLDGHFAGKSNVTFAYLTPWLSLHAWGVSVHTNQAGSHHTLHASTGTVQFNPLYVFGRRPVTSVTLCGLVARFREGESPTLFRRASSPREDAPAVKKPPPGPASARRRISLVPPIHFRDVAVFVGAPGHEKRVFRAASAGLKKIDDKAWTLDGKDGALGGLPYEQIHARLRPRRGSLLVGPLRLYAFHGLIGGYLETHSGAVNGELRFYELDVSEVWAAYHLPYAERREGRLGGTVAFSGERPSLDALSGKGTLQLDDANFYSPVSMKVLLFLEIPVAEPSVFRSGHMEFSFDHSMFYVESAHAVGSSFDLDAQGKITFHGAADLEVTHGATTVAVRGPVEDPSVTILPLNVVTRPIDRLFRSKVKDR